ncbi:ATP-binding protein [Candidatus Phytoplasma palmae]|uniref:ATP-binding protein n=1 Tax=Candidatus Phytoplasma palmae TaxID=85624 RepID=UPI003990CAB8
MCFFEKSYFKKMREFISKQEETKDLKIEDKDVLTVYNYLKNKLQSKNCSNYQMVLKTKPYVRVVLKETFESKKIDFENELNKINMLFQQEIKFENLKIFFKKNLIQEKVFSNIKDIISSFPLIEKSLYLYGPFGTGKTLFLKFLARELIKKRFLVLFFFMPDLTRQFRYNWNNNDAIENKLNYLKKIDCLILDDLGSENMNSFFRDEIFIPLLNYRYENKLPVFFSSNLNAQQLYEYFAFHKDFNSDIKAHKIIRFIKNMTFCYDFSS